MRKLFVWIALALAPLSAEGQTFLSQPLQGVSADSLAYFATDKADLLAAPNELSPTLTPLPTQPVERAALGDDEPHYFPVGTGLFDKPVYRLANMVFRSLNVFAHTANGAYINQAEALLLNEIMAYAYRGTPEERMAASRTLKMAANYVYAVRGDSVYCNFFQNAFVRLPICEPRLTIDQVSAFPFLPESTLRIGGIANGTRLTLCVRKAFWQSGEPTFYINGRVAKPQEIKNFYCFTRQWNRGDELRLSIPVAPILSPDRRFVSIGPIDYKADAPIEGEVRVSDELNADGHPFLESGTVEAQPIMDLPPLQK